MYARAMDIKTRNFSLPVGPLLGSREQSLEREGVTPRESVQLTLPGLLNETAPVVAPGVSVKDAALVSAKSPPDDTVASHKSCSGTSMATPHVAGSAYYATSLLQGAGEYPVDSVPLEQSMVNAVSQVENNLAKSRMREVISDRLGIWWADLEMVGSEKSMQQGWEPVLAGPGGDGASLKVRDVRMRSATHHFLMRETVERDPKFVLGVWRLGEDQPKEWVKHPEADVFMAAGDFLPAPTPARPRVGRLDI